jgi:carboxylesterase
MERSFPILFLHGFTSSLNSIRIPVEKLREAGFTVYTPLLRGHGTNYKDMVGTGSAEWYEDTEDALNSIHEKHNSKVGVAGFSMGGVVSIDLCIRNSKKIECLLLAAPALLFQDPLAGQAHLLGRLFKFWPSPKAYRDKSLEKKNNTNYPKFPVKSFVSLYNYAAQIRQKLGELTIPFHIIHSLKDQVISPQGSKLLAYQSPSREKALTWFKKSGHELFLDMESDKTSELALNYFISKDQESK